ncbi:MAG: hypothetical protein ACPGEG_00980 [Salibacteraceae bacterium]
MKNPVSFLISACIFALGFSSCELLNQKGKPSEDQIVARVFETYLDKSELEAIIPTGTDSVDSTILASNYVKNWIETQLLVNRAKRNLNANQLNFEDQLNEYRNNLIIYAYEQALVDQKLDTNITNEEIEAYYKMNSQNFELKDYVLRANWIKVDKTAPKIKKIIEAIQSNDEKDLKFLEDYCYQFADQCQLDGQWIYYNEFIKTIPIETISIEKFLEANKTFQIESEKFLYVVNIYEYQLKNSISPLELEIPRVKNIILNKRKIQLLGSIRNGLLEEGISKNNVEFY